MNTQQPVRLVDLLGCDQLTGLKVAVLGLAFKPGTDDVRESPAIPVVKRLTELGARVVAHDPAAAGTARGVPEFASIELAKTPSDALEDAAACIVVTAWPEYRGLKPDDFRRLMASPLILDGRGLYDPHELAAGGFGGVASATPRSLGKVGSA